MRHAQTRGKAESNAIIVILFNNGQIPLLTGNSLFGGSLKSKVYTDIGIILPNCRNPYYVQIMQDIGPAFHGTQYAMMPE